MLHVEEAGTLNPSSMNKVFLLGLGERSDPFESRNLEASDFAPGEALALCQEGHHLGYKGVYDIGGPFLGSLL